MTRVESTTLGAPCWVDLYTSDPERAEDFYGTLFGWSSEHPGEEYGGYTNFVKDGERLAGGMRNDGASGASDSWSVYLAVDNCEAVVEAAAKNGGQLIVPPMPVGDLGTMAVVSDANQAAVGMWQPGSFRGFSIVGEPGAPAWFELLARDYETAVRFYRDVFGWDTHIMGDTDDFR
ncbi:MAG TPA: VOC family protein, partial [Actinopolymorphaceae bacterium]